MPFPSRVGVVAGIVKDGGKRRGPTIQRAFVSGLADLVVCQKLDHVAQAYDVIVDAGHQHAARPGGID